MKNYLKYSIGAICLLVLGLSTLALAGANLGSILTPMPGVGMPQLYGTLIPATGKFSAHSEHTLNNYGWQNRYSTINVDSCHLTLSVKNLPDVGDDEVYEAWAIDTDSAGAEQYRLSLGRFKTSEKYGVGTLSFKSSCFWTPYDLLEITIEPYVDENAGSSGEVVMTGIFE